MSCLVVLTCASCHLIQLTPSLQLTRSSSHIQAPVLSPGRPVLLRSPKLAPLIPLPHTSHAGVLETHLPRHLPRPQLLRNDGRLPAAASTVRGDWPARPG